MRKTPNQLAFEFLPSPPFWKTLDAVAAQVRDFEGQFPDAIGYDLEQDGYIAVHSGHSRAALSGEMPVCVFLKKAGFGVVLLEESSFHKSPDVRVSGILFEIKTIKKTKNLKNGLMTQFRAAKTQSENLILNIEQKVGAEQLRSAVYYASFKTPSIKIIWVIWQGELFQFDRKSILKGFHRFA